MTNAPGRFDNESLSDRPPGTRIDSTDTSNPCIICGGTDREILYPFEPRDVVRCLECGFIYVHPMAEQGHFDDIYAGKYWTSYNVSVGEPDIHDRIAEFSFISQERVANLAHFKNTGTLLDIGCSMGFLVEAAEKAGFQSRGIDLSEETLAEGRALFGVDIFKAYIHDLSPNQSYDVITCFNTIEHIATPLDFLHQMRLRLAPDGLLVVGTHDVQSDNHHRERRLWKHIMPTEHLYYFRASDLVTLGERVGLTWIHSEKPIDNLIVAYYLAPKEIKSL